jgi:tetratricopeptide (TPR) repeat protein
MQSKNEKAEEQYLAAWKSDPANSMALEMLGKVAMQRGDRAGATGWFRQLSEAAPNKLQSWELLAGVAAQSGDVEDGVRAFRRIMELDPSRNHWADVGGLLLAAQRWHEAAEALEQAVQRGGVSPRVRLAWLYARLEDAGGSRGRPVPPALLDEAEAEAGRLLAAGEKDPQVQAVLRILRGMRRAGPG